MEQASFTCILGSPGLHKCRWLGQTTVSIQKIPAKDRPSDGRECHSGDYGAILPDLERFQYEWQ